MHNHNYEIATARVREFRVTVEQICVRIDNITMVTAVKQKMPPRLDLTGLLELAYKWGGKVQSGGQREGILSKNLHFDGILMKF